MSTHGLAGSVLDGVERFTQISGVRYPSALPGSEEFVTAIPAR